MAWLEQHASVSLAAEITLSTMGSRAWLVEAPGNLAWPRNGESGPWRKGSLNVMTSKR